MTQVFADDGQLGDMEMLSPAGRIPMPAGERLSFSLGPAMTPGKGVRRIRCVGCSGETLPRPDDGAPLCQRCSEVLAATEDALAAAAAWPSLARTPRWLRRRPPLD
jgi:hypothetical protein